MTDTAAQLRDAASYIRLEGNGAIIDTVDEIAALLEAAAADVEMCDRQNSHRPDLDGKTRILPHALVGPAAVLARKILGETE